jgi:hypothetical protein
MLCFKSNISVSLFLVHNVCYKRYIAKTLIDAKNNRDSLYTNQADDSDSESENTEIY